MTEDQKRDDKKPCGTYIYVHRELDVARTIEISSSVNVDLDAYDRVYGIEFIGDQIVEQVLLDVLRVLPQKISESAYRAGREAAARAIEVMFADLRGYTPELAAQVARGEFQPTEEQRPDE